MFCAGDLYPDMETHLSWIATLSPAAACTVIRTRNVSHINTETLYNATIPSHNLH